MPFITDPSRREELRALRIKELNKNKKPPGLRYRWYKFKLKSREVKKWIKDNPKESIIYILAVAEIINVIFNCIQTFK